MNDGKMKRAITDYRLNVFKATANTTDGGTADAVILRLEFDGEVIEFLMSPESARVTSGAILAVAEDSRKSPMLALVN
jgi:hypothetical protein